VIGCVALRNPGGARIRPTRGSTDLDLICSGCFTNPIGAQRRAQRDPAGTVVCSVGRISLPPGFPHPEPLRCDHCGSPMHLDRHHSTWYGIEIPRA